MDDVLVVVDMQSIYCSDDLAKNISKRIKQYIKANKKIIFLKDIGCDAWEYDTEEVDIHPIIKKNINLENHLIIEKEMSGSFELLNHISEKIYGIEICGVYTEICVLTNALFLRNKFPNVTIHLNESLCESASSFGQEAAIKCMQECGIIVNN